MEVFSTLRRRCASVLTENWSDLREQHRDQMFAVFRNLEPALVADIFDTVESDYYEQHYLTMSLQCKLVKRYRAQLADAKKQREEEVAELQQAMQEKTAEMRAIQKDLEAELSRHGDTSTRRDVLCSGAYRTQIPSTRKSGIPSPHKSMIPSPSKKVSTPSRPKETPDSKEPSQLMKAIESKGLSQRAPVPNPAAEKEQSSFFGFSMFSCSSPPIHSTTTLLPAELDTQVYQSKMANSWSHS